MIRKVTLFVFFCFAVFIVNAQVEKGKFLLSGSSEFSLSSSTSTPKYDGETIDEYEIKTSSFKIAPEFGYFVMDGLAVGVSLSYERAKSKFGDEDWSDPSTSLGIAAFGKYYIGESKFKPYGGAMVGYLSSASSNDDEYKFGGLALGFELGGAYFVNESIAIEAGLAYNYAKLKNSKDSKAVYNVGGLGLNIGVTVAF
ncbi:MAG: outer membrane beta-barrel protein [Bacteroidales bacterium]